MPFFSVCIPNYNLGHFLGETLQSVLSQTFEDFEIVIVDNASTDKSVEIIESFNDHRIRLFENRYNVGFAPNLQAVTRLANGDFIILLSSDDLMAPNALEKYHQVLQAQGERSEHTVLCASTDMIDENGKVSKICYRSPGQIFPSWLSLDQAKELSFAGTDLIRGKKALKQSLLHCSSLATFCSTVYPRCMWKEVEGYDTTFHYFPDNVFLYKLLAMDPDFIWVKDRLFSYRVHSSNQDSQAAKQAALKYQVDGYMQTVNYPQESLEELQLSRDDIINAFLKVVCIDSSLGRLSQGFWVQALKIYLFAFATYPMHTLRIPRTYISMILLGLGPLGILTAKIARNMFHKK